LNEWLTIDNNSNRIEEYLFKQLFKNSSSYKLSFIPKDIIKIQEEFRTRLTHLEPELRKLNNTISLEINQAVKNDEKELFCNFHQNAI
jgi:hypothetical protein